MKGLTKTERWIIAWTAAFAALFVTPDNMQWLVSLVFYFIAAMIIAEGLTLIVLWIKNNNGLGPF